MRFPLDENLVYENNEIEVEKILQTLRGVHEIPMHVYKGNDDWLLISILPNKESSIMEATLYVIQYVGRNKRYTSFILRDVFKNKQSLDLIINCIEDGAQSALRHGVPVDFQMKCKDEIEGLKLEESLTRLYKIGVYSPPPTS